MFTSWTHVQWSLPKDCSPLHTDHLSNMNTSEPSCTSMNYTGAPVHEEYSCRGRKYIFSFGEWSLKTGSTEHMNGKDPYISPSNMTHVHCSFKIIPVCMYVYTLYTVHTVLCILYIRTRTLTAHYQKQNQKLKHIPLAGGRRGRRRMRRTRDAVRESKSFWNLPVPFITREEEDHHRMDEAAREQ